MAQKLAARARACLDALPPAQREVVLLRDVEGLDAAEVCSVLGISDANQRVLLHRGRARVRCALGEEMGAMMRWLRRRALVCRDAVALMSDYLDRRLPARDAKRLEAPPGGLPALPRVPRPAPRHHRGPGAGASPTT